MGLYIIKRLSYILLVFLLLSFLLFMIYHMLPVDKAAEKAMTEVYGIEPVPSRGGGSIPILADLQRILGIDPLLMGFGLERDTIHSPNESYLLKQLFAGMEAIALFYRYY